jgi:hypothetical protein
VAFQLDNETVATPKLDVVTVDQLFCPDDGFAVIGTTEGSTTREVAVGPDDVGSILCHCTYPRSGASTIELTVTDYCRGQQDDA